MNDMAAKLFLVASMSLALVGCEASDGPAGYGELAKQVQQDRVGQAADQWIEMRNMAGEWERTGLIFGYADDHEECLKAIAGLKEVNYAREYRCVPAN